MLSHFRRPLISTLSCLTSHRALSFPGLAKSFHGSSPNRENISVHKTREAQLAAANERLIEPSSPESVEEQKYLLLDSLTPEFCEQLTGKITSKRFKLKSIQRDLEKLYIRGFPLPDSLTEEQWNNLMEFNSSILRVYYLVIILIFYVHCCWIN